MELLTEWKFLSRRQQMMEQARLRKASWKSSRISQRVRSRRNQCSSTSLRLDAVAGDDGGDALGTYQAAVLVVICPVSVDPVWSLARPPASTTNRWDGIDQR